MSESESRAYTASRTDASGIDVVELANPGDGTRVRVAPGLGNLAYEFGVNGKNTFWFPYGSIREYADDPDLCGNPFLAPWANRLDEHSFHVDGKKFYLNRGLGNYLLDPNDLPIHGLLLFAACWQVVDLRADRDGAEVTSRLDFGRHAELMAQFPFAHRIEMTHRLHGRSLETRTKISNTGAQPMPLSVGFHPYFQLHDCPRDEWTIRIAADSVWTLSDRFVPTGERSPVASMFPAAQALPLRGQFLDHVFGDLQRDGDGLARFRVRGKSESLTVEYGHDFPVAVVYAPTGADQSFLCFEPMSGVTNAFNLAHAGRYDDLPWIAPDETWEGSFRIVVEGF